MPRSANVICERPLNIILKLQSSTFNRNSRIGCSKPYFWDCTALLIRSLFSLIYEYSEFGNSWNHMMNLRVEWSVLKAFHGKVRKHQLCTGAFLTEVRYCKLPWWGRFHRGEVFQATMVNYQRGEESKAHPHNLPNTLNWKKSESNSQLNDFRPNLLNLLTKFTINQPSINMVRQIPAIFEL